MIGSFALRRRCIYAAYFSVLPGGIAALFLGLFPHLFFTSAGELFDSVSFFGFLENIRVTCFDVLSGRATAAANAVYFSYVMVVFWGLTCFLLVWYALFVLFTVLLSSVALAPRAASPVLNRWKRYYRILVPGRGAFVLLSCVPAVVSCLPYLFVGLYGRILGQSVALHYDLLPDVVPTALLSAVTVALFLGTLREQKQMKLDLFRLYKPERR